MTRYGVHPTICETSEQDSHLCLQLMEFLRGEQGAVMCHSGATVWEHLDGGVMSVCIHIPMKRSAENAALTCWGTSLPSVSTPLLL